MNDVSQVNVMVDPKPKQPPICVRPRSDLLRIQLAAANRRIAQQEEGINAALAELKKLPAEEVGIRVCDILLTALGE